MAEPFGARADIAAALARASAENRRVLLIWSATWSSGCTTFDKRCGLNFHANYERMYEYEVVRVDVGTRKLDQNADLANYYGAEFEAGSLPHLTVLDENGKLLANRPSRAFRDAKSHAYDIPSLVEFLRSQHAPLRKAEEVFAATMAQAKATDRRVLLTFGAPWEFEGDRFDDWLAAPHVRSVLEKEFVIRKVDVDRTLGGRELWARLCPKDDFAPRFGAVDTTGVLQMNFVRSRARNTGAQQKSEDAAFMELLARVSKSLTPADIEWLRQSLVPVWERWQRRGGH